jgi:galactokinase
MTSRHTLEAAGMSAGAAAAREEALGRLRDALRRAGGAAPVGQYFVPGRIEVLGKHTDYAGGRSLVCAVEHGFVVAAAPRKDDRVRVMDVAGGREALLALDPRLPEPRDAWARYPATVFRRVARNFDEARTGADIAFVSDLPLASGMSSSSAFMVAMYFAVATVNDLGQHPAYRRDIRSRQDLASYLATVENGQSFGSLTGDRGVGTFGGSEDHTAMLCCRAGELSQYSFCPVRHERQVPAPPGYEFVVAVSGVIAEKTGAAKDAYNRASLAVQAILGAWRAASGREDASLAAAVANGAARETDEIVKRATVRGFAADLLRGRFEQFVEESSTLVPAAGDALVAGDIERFGQVADRSQRLAEQLLRNQVPETVALAASARENGALAASAFGAGFGGSVWALVRAESVAGFVERWRGDYAARFPDEAARSAFLATRPGPAAMAI